jgi:hypothetical protein
MSKDKTPEEMAEDHANMRCPEQGPEFIVWCMCKDDFLTGYRAGRESMLDAITRMDSAIDRMFQRAKKGLKDE